MEYKIIREDKNAKFLVITPLYTGHKISRDTKVTIKRNKYPFAWITAEGKNNIPTNTWNGMEWYLDLKNEVPNYYIMIDNDIKLGRYMLDRLYDKLYGSAADVAYAYASFKFTGAIEKAFPAVQWDINKLIMHNYISSNSMFKTTALYDIGPVLDDKYKRLLDWGLLLKMFLERGWMGIPCPEANFEAVASPESISAGSNQDYDIKRRRIIEDFCKPIIQKYTQKPTTQPAPPQEQQATTMEF